MDKSTNPSKSIGNKASLAILITAAALMLMISGIQQYYSRKQIREDLERNAEMELVIKALNIKHSLEDVELALRNRSWEFEQFLPYPDSLFSVTRRIVEKNPNFDGCCIAMRPDYYPEKGRLFEPYTWRRNGVVETRQLGSEKHDYSKDVDFIISLENDTCVWREPYLDEYDDDVTLITYTFPVYDASGRVAGVVGLDLNAECLGKLLNARHLFPSSYDFLLSGKGNVICGPDNRIVKRQEVIDMANMINDSTFPRIVSSSGNATRLSFVKNEGEKCYVFYNSPKSLHPWTIAVVNYHKEVFAPLLKMRWRNLLLTLAGLLVLGFIIQRTANSFRKLQQANLEKERIDNELNIAKKIQMDMLPKPDWEVPRDDIGICGSLVPARIVGGDLYDHFIRDEKLFFCIGDVSGKGVPAALVMAVVHTLFRSVSAHESRPNRIMQTLNENACQGNDTNMFVTFFIGVLDLPTGKLRYCNAGHDRPIIIGKDIRTLPAKANLPLGVMDDIVYIAQEETLASNETIFLFTDGLTEAKNLKHEQFGMTRLNDTLSQIQNEEMFSPVHLINKVTEQVNAFVQEAEQSDDLTLLAIQYTPKEKEIIFRNSLTITNTLSEITRLNAFVVSATQALHIETGLANKLKLAVEEAVTNIIDYAYPSDTKGNVDIMIEADASRIRFVITDSGFDFDPTSVSKVDTTLSVEERPIGGLGIFLVRNLMDSINYERIDGKNVLRLEKRYL